MGLRYFAPLGREFFRIWEIGDGRWEMGGCRGGWLVSGGGGSLGYGRSEMGEFREGERERKSEVRTGGPVGTTAPTKREGWRKKLEGRSGGNKLGA